MTLAVPPAGPIRRVAYLGTPELAVPPLRALVDDGVDVALVVSQPDRRRGRGSELVPSPGEGRRRSSSASRSPIGSTTCSTPTCRSGVVVAFGRLIKPHVLEAVPMVNLHFSLLPRWRGAAPVERAILAGDERTGVDLMAVEEGLDTGGTYRRAEVPIGPDDTLEELRGRLVDGGHPAAASTRSARASATPTPQAGEPTYADKLTAEDRHLDWSGAGRRRPPPRPPRRRVDDARRQAPQGVAHPRPAARRRPAGRARPTARSSWSRCSPRARAGWTPRRGPTAPAGSPATPLGS